MRALVRMAHGCRSLCDDTPSLGQSPSPWASASAFMPRPAPRVPPVPPASHHTSPHLLFLLFKIILIDLVKERVREIENKNTDTNSNAKKVVAWNDLKERCFLIYFNCMCQGAPRTVSQLKAQWGLMKIKEKKRKAEQRKELFKTGGGPPPVKEVPTEDIGSWLPNEFVVDSNEFDSDNVNQHMRSKHSKSDMSTGSDCWIIMNVNNAEAPPPAIPSTSSSILDPPSSEKSSTSQMLGPKPGKIKKKCFSKGCSPADEVAACEIECRRELHRKQMLNQDIETSNLQLQGEL
ncbi:uncharacterized protein LOC124542494, partial [Vanessa cardui]|uniref:uncharacterized protein LOC124542494 n=1 Tax=Vanessa cardui TaxID=171605 RepID=UPI001F144CFD